MESDLRFDLPTVEPDTATWWASLSRGVIQVERCRSCDDVHLYPRTFCPRCWSDDVELEPASGRASLYSFSVVHMMDLPPFGARVPYVVGIVELEEGPRLMTNIVGVQPTDVAIGMALRLKVRPLTDDLSAADFEPMEA